MHESRRGKRSRPRGGTNRFRRVPASRACMNPGGGSAPGLAAGRIVFAMRHAPPFACVCADGRCSWLRASGVAAARAHSRLSRDCLPACGGGAWLSCALRRRPARHWQDRLGRLHVRGMIRSVRTAVCAQINAQKISAGPCPSCCSTDARLRRAPLPAARAAGKGNVGMQGVRQFMLQHKCNDICRALRLQSLTGRAKPSQHGTQWGSGGKRGRAAEPAVGVPLPPPPLPPAPSLLPLPPPPSPLHTFRLHCSAAAARQNGACGARVGVRGGA